MSSLAPLVEGRADEQKTPVASASLKPVVLNHKPVQRFPLKCVNVLGAGLRRLGVQVGDLDPERLCQEASRRTGLHDWGGSEFHEPLAVLLEAVRNAPEMHAFGRLAVHSTLVHALANRLLLRAYWNRFPESLEAPIQRPLFIVGPPRSGTTLLFNLLAQDRDHRPLLNWEASTPAPSARRGQDRDYKYAAGIVRRVHYLLPDLRHKHDFGVDAPEECNILFLNSLESEILHFWYDIPEYRTWLNGRDRVGSYVHYGNQLRLLQHLRPGRRWLLKCPSHIYSLAALLTVFPDACIVQTHRDPLKVLPSTCSLAATYRGLCYPVVEYARLGEEAAEQLNLGLVAWRVERMRFPAHHFYDVHYHELVNDPIASARAIYEHFDLALGETTVQRMRDYMAAHPQNKYGVHRYSLEEFGLNPQHERARFADYVNAHRIRENA